MVKRTKIILAIPIIALFLIAAMPVTSAQTEFENQLDDRLTNVETLLQQLYDNFRNLRDNNLGDTNYILSVLNNVNANINILRDNIIHLDNVFKTQGSEDTTISVYALVDDAIKPLTSFASFFPGTSTEMVSVEEGSTLILWVVDTTTLSPIDGEITMSIFPSFGSSSGDMSSYYMWMMMQGGTSGTSSSSMFGGTQLTFPVNNGLAMLPVMSEMGNFRMCVASADYYKDTPFIFMVGTATAQIEVSDVLSDPAVMKRGVGANLTAVDSTSIPIVDADLQVIVNGSAYPNPAYFVCPDSPTMSVEVRYKEQTVWGPVDFALSAQTPEQPPQQDYSSYLAIGAIVAILIGLYILGKKGVFSRIHHHPR